VPGVALNYLFTFSDTADMSENAQELEMQTEVRAADQLVIIILIVNQ